MRTGFLVLVFGLSAGMGLRAADGGAQVFIGEFMALNDGAVEDEDHDFSDWIELFNNGAVTANLEGCYLTDQADYLTKWRFPAVTLEPLTSLVVYASGKNRVNPAYPLHTNFKLLADGEFLALVAPDGVTVLSSFSNYPPQVSDVSYGFMQGSSYRALIGPQAPVRALVPKDGSLGSGWTLLGLSELSWLSGTTGVGFDRGPDYLPLIGIDTGELMYTINATAYLRLRFTIDDPAALKGLRLRMKYDDGFVAFINGIEIARRNAPSPLAWNSSATADRPDALALEFEDFAIDLATAGIRSGTNIFAIQGLNNGSGSSDFLIVPELEVAEPGALDTSAAFYLETPTPGWGNSNGAARVSGAPQFSHESGTYVASFQLVISATAPGAVIRYTTDGSVPTASSRQYASPITISQNTLVRARVFEPDSIPGPTGVRAFTLLDSGVRSFSSNLPLVVISTFGKSVDQADYKEGFGQIFAPAADGRARLTGVAEHRGLVGIKIRGSSASGFPKHMYALETWDDKGTDRAVSFLGFPAESDWVLNGSYSDKSLMRNALAYGFSNDMDCYAPRTRFVEVFLKESAGLLTSNDYLGVYILCEKIKRDEDRVDVEKLVPSQDLEPEISGGYILKVDRPDPGDVGFSTSKGNAVLYVEPKEQEITGPQKVWLKGYMDQFETALYDSQWRNPTTGYARFIDPEAWVDHYLLVELTKNIDGFRLSTFYYKDRNGKLAAGPIWDYDLCFGNANYADGWIPQNWYSTITWWSRLITDVDFIQLFIDRWQSLRRGVLSNDRLMGKIDAFAAEIAEAQVRNFQKWQILGKYVWPNWYIAPTWQDELTWMKGWLTDRVTWIDGNYTRPPTFSRDGGPIEPGFALTMAAPSGTIYYTLNGADPRLPGGSTLAGAKTYTAPVTLTQNTRVRARAKVGSNWSGIVNATFYTTKPDVVVSEIMYHPANPPEGSPFNDEDFEFIELVNRGTVAVDMTGVRFADGIQFTFSEGTIIAPDGVVVLVKNADAFATRYFAPAITIAGQYVGNLENAGERIAIEGPLGEPIMEFTFDDLWHSETDGAGASLTSVDPYDASDRWDDPASWEASVDVDGTPGVLGASVGGMQLPGDVNQDGALDISDAVGLLRHLFRGTPIVPPCEGATLADGGNAIIFNINGNGGVDVADAVAILAHLFGSGPPPAGGATCLPVLGCPRVCIR